MKTIRNLTSKPLKVPLPRGKMLRLGYKADGIVQDQAADHPGVKRMVESGMIEILDGSSHGYGPTGRKNR
jgi:hypothetical protein